ncbi:MAG TPA: hypothetical protein VFA26_05460 [Gemmataceae bacterium]|nr:hypothetical protein [Gemmataceae bacterium]
MDWPWLVLIGTVGIVVAGAVVLALVLLRPHRVPVEQARRLFLMQREHLEAHFLRAANASGRPRGLRWKECDWEHEVLFARDRQSGELTALVGVTIRFEAVPGGDMEGVAAVGNLRNASAVFFFRGGRWQTQGKAVFNLNPGEALEHFKNQYERVENG